MLNFEHFWKCTPEMYPWVPLFRCLNTPLHLVTGQDGYTPFMDSEGSSSATKVVVAVVAVVVTFQTRNSARLTDQRGSYAFSCIQFSIHVRHLYLANLESLHDWSLSVENAKCQKVALIIHSTSRCRFFRLLMCVFIAFFCFLKFYFVPCVRFHNIIIDFSKAFWQCVP